MTDLQRPVANPTVVLREEDEATDHLKEFIQDLTSKGLVGYAEAA